MTINEYLATFDKYRMYIFYFCKKTINHQEEAEDITTETFINLWNNRDSVLVGKAKAYLLVTANRKCHDYLRRSKTYSKILTTIPMSDLDEVEIDANVLGFIYKTIESLPPQQKRILTLMYKDGKKVNEIVKMLNLKEPTVRNTLHSGLTKLRGIIKNRGITHG